MKVLKIIKRLFRPLIVVRTLKGEVIIDRRCKVCTHPQRAEIEKMLLEGRSYDEIREKFGISQATLSRHFKKHMPRLVLDPEELNRLYEEHRVKQIDLQEELLKLIGRLENLFRKLETLDRLLAEGKKVSWYAYVQSIGERRQILKEIRETMLTINELKSEIKTEKDLSELLQKLREAEK